MDTESSPESSPVLGGNSTAALTNTIKRAKEALFADQHKEGYWFYELECDCTVTAENIMMMHYMDEIDVELQEKMATYIRRRQNEAGGWPLYYGGESDISCTVKAYYALKMAGDDIDEEHMAKARELILSMGGAAKANVFTRINLAKFEQLPWRAVPFVAAEIMMFPKWFPLHLMKVSYWSRTVMVPLFILYTLKVKARNPHNIGIRELFTVPPEEEKHYFKMRSLTNRFVFILERIALRLERFIPQSFRQKAIDKAESWFIPRLNGEDGLGAIYPAIRNAYEAMDALGYPEDHPNRVTTKKALQKLLVIRDDEAYCQPCLSPIWDTILSSGALIEINDLNQAEQKSITDAANWLISKQLTNEPGDWRLVHPDLQGGSWPFQFQNDYYPDLDDTAFAAYILYKIDSEKYKENILRAARWLRGMQSKHGGFAAFETDNTYYYLNEIPFADHGALLDPPTADVSARCAMIFGELKDEYPEFQPALNKTLHYLYKEQKKDGSWFGRWGTNHIYGTWSVLMGFESAGISTEDSAVKRAVAWLKRMQHDDGGWGEDNWSYHDPETRGFSDHSTTFQTAWALLGLMSAGEVTSETVEKGIDFLIASQRMTASGMNRILLPRAFPVYSI